jgi:hypothetical protein
MSVAALCLLAAPLPAMAQISTPNQIIGCQSIDNDIARLECFDQVAARLNPVSTKPESRALTPVIPKTTSMAPKVPTPVAPNAEAEAKSVIQDFGKDVKAAPKPKEAALLTPKGDVVFTVKHVQIFDYVKKRFYMTNGQVWEQTTAANLDIEEGKPPAGTTAEISKSGFGGYKLKINDKKWGVKVKRVR